MSCITVLVRHARIILIQQLLLGHETWNGIVFVCPLAICAFVRRWNLSIRSASVCLQRAASWWWYRSTSRSMLVLHRHQDGSLQIRKQDILVQFARRLGLDVPRQEAYSFLIQVEVTRAWARLVVFHEPLRLIDVPLVFPFFLL